MDILKNVVIFFGVLLAYAFVELFNAPKSVVGWTLLATLEIKHYQILWIAYSIIYWASDLPKEDNFVLIAITTLAYAALISLAILLPQAVYSKHRVLITRATKGLVILPIVCNNLLYRPFLGCFRYGCYMLLEVNKKNHHNVTGVYILFSKSETLLPLMAWHMIMEYLSWKVVHPSQLPVVVASDDDDDDNNDDDIHQLANVIKTKQQSRAQA